MLVLAIDTCDSRGSVSLLRQGKVVGTVAHEGAEDYSSWLLPAVERALTAESITMPDVGLYAIAAGPGSFTGVRVGLTTVKAWSEVYARPIAAVSRLEALAIQTPPGASWVAAFTDARRGQVFGALYRKNGTHLKLQNQEMVAPPGKFADWVSDQAGKQYVTWVSTDPTVIASEPAWALRQAGGETIQVVSGVLAPMIGQLGLQHAKTGSLIDALTLEANYVRRSDAEIFWKR
ncbi:MAG TPA: tRNA (adenosine(37)-N6)-threonylcarbamoyltransferase complex dimerization subunit type 1 TsaB [Candidatus Dormibacteraeota bacterium]|nr:tRNA (adenosine(37)-N6)-threonylcarbamoyltransferase complex dimerization subunit type 1 TsaB [Candidatus Dormibacteraeota bacterium]